ncbi:YceI family protein [Maricaulis sp.]|uniref:YceI family protein n=1 Tax=Maricaulis sp. TaxID=1486257 RepID=UPI0026293E19|nr:YceI family protein [Maricaulis sp.]
MLRSALAALLLTASPALAQDWTVDPEASRVGFETSAFGSTVTGAFDQWSAEITLDPADLTSARIDATVSVATGSTGNGQLDQSMLSAEGLAPESHALARFTSSDIRAAGDGYEAHGTLNIRGADQAVVLPFTLAIADGRAIADGALEIARLDYGVGDASWGETAASVTIVLHIEADAAE